MGVNVGGFAFSLFLLLIGVFLYIKVRSTLKAIDRYEFENRTSGDVVEFSSYEDRQSHNRRRKFAHLLVVPMLAFLIIGGFGVILSII